MKKISVTRNVVNVLLSYRQIQSFIGNIELHSCVNKNIKTVRITAIIWVHSIHVRLGGQARTGHEAVYISVYLYIRVCMRVYVYVAENTSGSKKNCLGELKVSEEFVYRIQSLPEAGSTKFEDIRILLSSP